MAHFDVAAPDGNRHDMVLLLNALNDSTREWREYLEQPSVEAIIWQPVPGFHSIGGCLLEIATVEIFWFLDNIKGLVPDPEEVKELMGGEIDVDNVNWPVPPAQPIDWYFAHMDRIRKRSLEILSDVDPDQIVTRPSGNTFTARWVVNHVVQHDSYHGGQAVLLHELWKKREL